MPALDPDFVQRLRHPDLEGVRFKDRVRRVRQQMAAEAWNRRQRRIGQITTALTVLALLIGIPAGWHIGSELADHRDENRRAQFAENARLRWVIWDVQDRIAREEYARRYLRSRITEYVHGRIAPVQWTPGRLSQAPSHWLFKQPNLPRSSFAFFEAFPLDGTGSAGVCATTSPSGVHGEVLTLTRSSTAMCTRTSAGGLSATGIQNGDMVSVGTSVPRVEFDSTGALGLLVESARTNSCLRSQELDDPAWSLQAFTCSSPTRTANAATAPDGSVTAEQIDVPACASGSPNRSMLFTTTTIALTAASWTFSAYVKGVSTSGTFYVAMTPDGVTYIPSTITCNFASATWSRCIGTFTGGLANYYFVIGSDHRDPSQTASFSAASFYLWGVQIELGSFPTSYIPTVAATVTRAAEVAFFTLSGTTEVQSIASTIQLPANLNATDVRVIGDAQGAVNTLTGYAGGPGAVPLHAFQNVGGTVDFSSSNNITLGAINRLVAWVIPSSTIGTVVNGTQSSTSTALGAVTGVTKFYVGNYAGGVSYENNAINSRLCVDPVSTRCR